MPANALVPFRRSAAVMAGAYSSGVVLGGGTPPDSSPSGQAMPTTAPTGWTRYFGQDFNTDTTNFLATYGPPTTSSFDAAAAIAGNGYVSAYPRTYFDTRGQRLSSAVDGRGGRYDPANLTCAGGVMRIHIHYDATDTAAPGGMMSVAAPVPKLSASSAAGGWGYLGSRRQSVRFRYVGTNRASTKIAWLNWPFSNHSTTLATAGIPDSTSTTGFRGGDGELDYPEQDGGSFAQWFVHNQNAKDSDTGTAKQRSGTATGNFFDGGWHTATSEVLVGSYSTGTSTWVGQSWKAFWDGVQVGSTLTTAVPMTPMRWVLQCETTLSYSTPLDTTIDYHFEVDWITVDVPA